MRPQSRFETNPGAHEVRPYGNQFGFATHERESHSTASFRLSAGGGARRGLRARGATRGAGIDQEAAGAPAPTRMAIFSRRCVMRCRASRLRTAMENAAGSPTMKTFFLARVMAV